MKHWAFVAVLLGLVAVWYVSRSHESFVSDFLDRGNETRTRQRAVSSFSQETNHFKPTPQQLPPVPGIETPFRVNQWQAFVPTD